MKKEMSGCACGVFMLVMITVIIAVIACVNSPEPIGAKEAFEKLTYVSPEGHFFYRYDDAWRCRNGEVRAQFHRVWTNPLSGYILAEEGAEQWDTIALRGDDVVLFAGEIFPNQDFFLERGKLFLRTDVRKTRRSRVWNEREQTATATF